MITFCFFKVFVDSSFFLPTSFSSFHSSALHAFGKSWIIDCISECKKCDRKLFNVLEKTAVKWMILNTFWGYWCANKQGVSSTWYAVLHLLVSLNSFMSQNTLPIVPFLRNGLFKTFCLHHALVWQLTSY